MTNSPQQGRILFRKDFWIVFLRQAGFVLGGIFLLGVAVAAGAYFWKLHTRPQSIDAYLPIETTVGYMDMTFTTGSSARTGLFADLQAGQFGFLPKEVMSGSGAIVLDELLGERLGVALLRERQGIVPVYFAEFTDRSALEQYISTLGHMVPSALHPSIMTLQQGGSFYFMFLGKYWIVAPSPDVLLVLLNREFSLLVKDPTYLLGRGHLASRASGKGYVHIPLLMEYVFSQEHIRPLVRDMYLLAKPMVSQMTQIVWNVQAEEKRWSVVSIVHAEKSFMEYFRQVMKVQSGQPIWHGKPVSFAVDTARLDDWRVSLGRYLKEANDPLVIILRSYLEESSRVFANGMFAEGFPVLGYGALLGHLDPVTLRPTVGVYAHFDPVDQSFLSTWMSGVAPVLLDMLSNRTESMTRRTQTIGEYTVTLLQRSGYDVYAAIAGSTLLLAWGDGAVIEQWLLEPNSTDAKYPLVRTSSYLVDVEAAQRLWDMEYAPMTSTGSFLHSLDMVYGGLRTFEDGARFEFSLEMR